MRLQMQMQPAVVLALFASQAMALLSLSGDGFMTTCVNIAQGYQWPNHDNCVDHLSPDRAVCLLRYENFVLSVSGCARTLAELEGATDEELADDVKTFATGIHYVHHALTKSWIMSQFSLSSDYASWPVTQWDGPADKFEARVSDMNPHNITSPVQFPSYVLERAVPDTMNMSAQRTLARNMGAGILAYWGVIFAFRAVVMFCYRYAPVVVKAGDSKLTRFVRRYIILPPLLHFHHASPYRLGRYLTFQLPTRVTSITVLGFVAVNYVLMFVRVQGGQSGAEYGVPVYGYNYYLSSRAAQLVLYKLPIIFLFSGRNNFLLFITGWSMNEFSIFHKWVGRVTFIDTIIHGAAATNWAMALDLYSSMSVYDTQFRWGFACIALLCTIFLQSIHWLRRLNYELFKYMHMALSIVFLIMTWQHIVYSFYGRPYMYACWAIWIFDHVMRWTRILVSGLAHATFVYHGGVLEITIEHSKWWQPRGGNHAFIHVLAPNKFWQSHPFSLMRAIKVGEENKLKVIARAKDGITRDWVERCIKNGGSFDCRVMVDGPYGSRRNFKFFEELVFIAGGIGISSPYAYLQNKVRRDAHQTISLYWGIPNEEPLTWFSHELEYLANSGKFSIHIYIGLDPGDTASVTAPADQFINQFNSDSSLEGNQEKDPFKTSLQGNVHFYSHQMDVPAVIADHILNSAGPTAFLTCGPADMNDTARQAFVQNFEKSRFLCEHFEEHFSW